MLCRNLHLGGYICVYIYTLLRAKQYFTPRGVDLELPERPGVHLYKRDHGLGVERWRAFYPGANHTETGPESFNLCLAWLAEKHTEWLSH